MGRTKFPAAVLPFVIVLSSCLNYLFSLLVLFIVMLAVGFPIGVSVLSLPLIWIVQFLLTLGLVLALSALSVYYRDVYHLTTAIIPGLFFLTPVLYTVEMFPERLRFLIYANPMALLEMSYRSVLFHQTFPSLRHLSLALAMGLAALLGGLKVFEHFRDAFAEEL